MSVVPRHADLISEIRSINRAVSSTFLRTFPPDALSEYLSRLRLTEQPRGRDSRWVRREGRPAVQTREPCDA